MSLSLLHDINPGDDIPNEITVVVEINKGSKNKYELDKVTGLIKLDRVMHTGQDYPFDYGFVPRTHWHDGDPLDVVLITTYPLVPGTLLTARPVGVLDMVDGGDSDAKIIAVPVEDPRFNDVVDLHDVNQHTIKEIVHFFETYKQLQTSHVKVDAIRGAKDAKEIIKEALDIYKNKNFIL